MDISKSYPVTLTIDYPDRDLNRMTTFFRPIVAIPICIVLTLISGGGNDYFLSAGGILFAATVLMILFRRKYPRWWFDWNMGVTRFSVRVCAYLCLMRDEYPSTDDEQAVHLDIAYPDVSELSQGLPLVKWFLVIPHYIILTFLWIAAVCCVFIAWIAIIFTGHYPRGLFDFVTGVLRWHLRVAAYAFLLVTDIYPPFSLT